MHSYIPGMCMQTIYIRDSAVTSLRRMLQQYQHQETGPGSQQSNHHEGKTRAYTHDSRIAGGDVGGDAGDGEADDSDEEGGAEMESEASADYRFLPRPCPSPVCTRRDGLMVLAEAADRKE